MASRTEGIALLSMYNDDDEEDEEEDERQHKPAQASAEIEMEDVEDQKKGSVYMPKEEQKQQSLEKSPQGVVTRTPPFSDEVLERMAFASSSVPVPTPSPPLRALDLASVGSVRSPSPLPVPSDATGSRSGRGTLAIVDYEHDDTAMSPEPEEGEIVGTGLVVPSKELQNTQSTIDEKTADPFQTSIPNLQPSQTQPCEQPMVSSSEAIGDVDAIERVGEVSLSVVEGETSEQMQEDMDPLSEFLTQPPIMRCPQALQDKINKFLALKKSGKRFNAEIRKMKEYRNPDFLQHAVTYQGINQTGTCFHKDVFDPEGYDPKDYYDEIEADMKREIEKREQERKRSPKIDFISGGTQSSVVVPPKINGIPVASVAAVSASGQQLASVDSTSKESRPNKKSKWDKVDNDSRNPSQSGGHDNVSTAGAHATLLSVSGAGAGYTAFAQQKRKEAEERRSGERKFEKRS